MHHVILDLMPHSGLRATVLDGVRRGHGVALPVVMALVDCSFVGTVAAVASTTVPSFGGVDTVEAPTCIITHTGRNTISVMPVWLQKPSCTPKQTKQHPNASPPATCGQ